MAYQKLKSLSLRQIFSITVAVFLLYAIGNHLRNNFPKTSTNDLLGITYTHIPNNWDIDEIPEIGRLSFRYTTEIGIEDRDIWRVPMVMITAEENPDGLSAISYGPTAFNNFPYKDFAIPEPPQTYFHPNFDDAISIPLLSAEDSEQLFELIVLAHGDSFLTVALQGDALYFQSLSAEIDNLIFSLKPTTP